MRLAIVDGQQIQGHGPVSILGLDVVLQPLGLDQLAKDVWVLLADFDYFAELLALDPLPYSHFILLFVVVLLLIRQELVVLKGQDYMVRLTRVQQQTQQAIDWMDLQRRFGPLEQVL